MCGSRLDDDPQNQHAGGQRNAMPIAERSVCVIVRCMYPDFCGVRAHRFPLKRQSQNPTVFLDKVKKSICPRSNLRSCGNARAQLESV